MLYHKVLLAEHELEMKGPLLFHVYYAFGFKMRKYEMKR